MKDPAMMFLFLSLLICIGSAVSLGRERMAQYVHINSYTQYEINQ